MTRRVAAPGLTVKVPLTPALKPVAVAVSCLLVPAESIRKSVKAAAPLPLPMSRVAVPVSGPLPEPRFTVTFRLPGKPIVELLPKGSWDLTTGCVPKTEPAVALAGLVVKASRSAVAALTAMGVEVALVRLPLLKRRVMLVARLCARLV